MLRRVCIAVSSVLLLWLFIGTTGTPSAHAAASWVNVGSPGFSAGDAEYTSLAFEGGTPYVAYRDGSNSYKATVMKFDGTNWVNVGSPGFSAGDAEYTSLAFEGGTPYVAYTDVGNSNKATVMRFTDPQSGPNFVVNSAADTDDGECSNAPMDCTLREAINAANARSGDDTITFDIPDTGADCASDNVCTITLGALGSLPAINDDVTIDGAPNNGKITVSGADSYRVLLVNAGIALNLNQMTIVHGRTIADGGGLDNEGGNVTITNSTFAYNSATSGSGRGGAIYNTGMLTIRSSTFHHNTSPYYGAGAIESDGGTTNISNSTFNQNDGQGGGAIVNNATLNIWNSTVSGNNFGITSSSAATLKNTIIAANTEGDCYGTINANASNLDSDGSCDNATQKSVSEIALTALADNGGPTQTMALGNSSVAIDAGNAAVCADNATVNNLDQRGNARDDLQCDIGAFEFVNSDGHTIAKNNFVFGPLYTFGPTLAGITSGNTFNDSLAINREIPGTHPGTPPANALTITWDATTSGSGYSFLVTLCYDPNDPSQYNGQNESALHVWHYNGSTWDDLGGTLDTTTHAPYHCVTATTALTSLSPLILAPGAPTATIVTGVKGFVNAKNNIVLRWKTTTESQIAGFNVYRKTGKGEWKQINANFIQAKHAGSAQGDKYRFADKTVKSGKTYRYKIEIVYLDEHTEWTKVVKVVTAGNSGGPPPRDGSGQNAPSNANGN